MNVLSFLGDVVLMYAEVFWKGHKTIDGRQESCIELTTKVRRWAERRRLHRRVGPI